MVTISDYRNLLESDAITGMRKIPWVLDGEFQGDDLWETLVRERDRFEEDQWIRIAVVILNNGGERDLTMASIKSQSFPAGSVEVLSVNSLHDLRQALETTTAEMVQFLQSGHLLHPQWLGIVAREVRKQPQLEMISSNQISVDHTGTKVGQIRIKPSFSRSLMTRVNYLESAFCMNTGVLQGLVKEMTTDPGDRFFTHEILLNWSFSRSSRKSLHVPVFGYFDRELGQTTLDLLPAMQEAEVPKLRKWMTSRFPGATVEPSRAFCRTSRPWSRKQRILVVIPYRDQVDLTIKCLESLENQDSSAMSVVLVDNNSNRETKDRIRVWVEQSRIHSYIGDENNQAFNYAKLNNWAVDLHKLSHDFVLFLNNDVELTDPHTISAMASELENYPENGLVGIRLMYPGGTDIQHGGIRMRDYLGSAGYFDIGHHGVEKDYIFEDHPSLGVTFACAMTRIETFDALGGLEEHVLPNGFGDVAFALEAARKNLDSFYLGTISAIHHESVSRKTVCEDYEYSWLHQKYAQEICHLRTRQMTYDHKLKIGLLERENSGWLALPPRYQAVDRLNFAVKKYFGPLHKSIKTLVKGR